MKRIVVNASKKYDVIVGEGILKDAGKYAKDALGRACKACILTDDNVAPIYLDAVKSSLAEWGFETVEFIIPHGERSKNTECLVSLVEFMANNRLTRSDCLVALGGGVVGDLGGFAASVYLRGIPFIQMPTTLLAAVDSSVGGKTAVDLVAGKNLMGAFYQPSVVICDCLTLNTLPKEVFSDGCAEVIKYGVINDRAFFDSLKGGISTQLEDVISACVKNKAEIVERDEFDKGERQLLNLGHTVGHGIETCSDFAISHGSAVAMGMVIVMRMSCAMGICKKEELSELTELLRREGLPTECDFGAKELSDIGKVDKKRDGGVIRLVMPYAIGDCRLMTVSVDELEELIQKGLN